MQTYTTGVALLAALALFAVWLLSAERRMRDELRRNNEALRDSESKLKDAERLANIGYWERDAAGRVNWSEQAARIFGRPTPATVTAAELLAMIHPDDRARRTAMLNDALEGRRLYDIEYRIVRPDGEVRHVHVRENTSGGSGARFGTVQDITERKRAEMALQKSEQLLRETQALVHTGSWEHHLVTGEFVNTEENLRLFFGDDRSKGARFEHYTEAVHPDDRAYVTARHAQLLEGVGPPDLNYRVVWPDGSVHVLSGLATVVRDPSGRPVRIYGTNVDITDRKRADDAARELHQLLQQVLATLPVGVVVVDRAGDILLSNDASKRIWGAEHIVSGQERLAAVQASWHDTGRKVAPKEWASVRAVTQGQTSVNELIDIEGFDGRMRTVQNYAAPIHDTQGAIRGAVVVNEDVTVRIQADKALREYARRLQSLSRRLLEVQEDERRRLALELHDEFGQLLATITLRLHTVLRHAGDTARAELEECMSLLQRAGDQVRRLALELRPTLLETAGLDAALRSQAEQHQHLTGIPTEVVGHVGEVSSDAAIACFRVVQEALTNVVRHARARHVRIELRQTESAVDLAVIDDGVGFEVEKTAGQAADRGSLGLLGMKERLQILGGSVEVSSHPGQGTRVRLWLPLRQAMTA